MADQASIFEEKKSEGQPSNNQPSGGTTSTVPDNQLATMLAEIKNERGEPKYKTVQDALNALKHSQEYIPTLKQTKEELEARLQKAEEKAAQVERLEQAVLELTQKSTTSQSTPAGMSEEDIAKLVERTLTQTQQKEVQKQNLSVVVDAMKERFGEKAEEIFYGKANELGLSVQEFNALAAKTPKAVLKLIGVEDKPKAPGFGSTVNTTGFTPKQDSFVKRNSKSALLGATTQDLQEESRNAKQLVDELHSQGKTISDLTNPKEYFKHFN
jgi:hypothetical protein